MKMFSYNTVSITNIIKQNNKFLNLLPSMIAKTQNTETSIKYVKALLLLKLQYPSNLLKYKHNK